MEVSAAKGSLKVSGRKDLHLESTEGEVSKRRGKFLLGDLRHSELYFTAELCPKQTVHLPLVLTRNILNMLDALLY